MGLFDMFKKKDATPQPSTPQPTQRPSQEKNTNSMVQLLQWCRDRDTKLNELHIAACNASTIQEEKLANEKFLAYFQEYKAECEKMGKDYIEHFSQMFEHAHNSKNPDFSMGEVRQQRLDYINANYNELIQEEAKKNELLRDLDKKIIDIIKNQPGIMQNELIKSFDPIIKQEISNILYNLAKDGKINREKSGKSYSLTIK